ncbi:MAG: hypothetical protein SOV58_01760 [Candidatus Enteromonas sp.]|nr:hypothetical protein [Candidatus Enteromonas sp.]
MDALICVAFTIAISPIGDAVMSSLPSFHDTVSKISKLATEKEQIILESHLGNKKDEKSFYTVEELTHQYVLGLTKTSLLHYGAKEADLSSIYEGIPDLTIQSDRLGYYYSSFKVSNLDQYNEKGIVGEKEYTSLLILENSSLFNGDSYPLLTQEIAIQIDEALRNDTYELGKAKMEAIHHRYRTLFLEACEDLETHFTPYVVTHQRYEASYRDFITHQDLTLIFCAAFSILVFYLLLPLFLKGRTISMRVLRLHFSKNNGDRCSNSYICMSEIPVLLATCCIAFLAALFTSSSYVFSPVIGPLSFAFFGLLSLVLCLVNYLFTFFGNKQTGKERLFKLTLVGGMEEEAHGN